jgi:uncharacterized protein YutE (UPF0331/DUF86 family)
VAALTENPAAKGMIGARLSERLDDLRKRRNYIVHNDPQVTQEEVAEYYENLGTALAEMIRTSLYQ